MTQRLRVEVRGAVQGVGFRPFVYRVAVELGLTGWVINDGRGVRLEVEGPRAALERFLARVTTAPPPRARVEGVDHAWQAPVGFARFEIRASDDADAKTVLVLPDVATCPACVEDVARAGDRREGYPFTNCTDCGPRFSIVVGLPYDRPNTTMRGFALCPDCQREYDDPADRRFHAQPNACPVCGPRVALWDADGVERTRGADALAGAAAALEAGEIVAVKGLGGFHLMADATSAPAVARLRERKRRPAKPLAIMVRDLAAARAVADVDGAAAAELASPEAPLLLLPRRPGSGLAEGLSPDTGTVGVMLPYTPLHHLLLARLDAPVVATSGNLSDEPICTDEREARRRLGGIADAFLVHDRPIARHVDDSVAWMVAGRRRLLRRARGYVPLPVRAPGPGPRPAVLAVGPHLKSTVALGVGERVFLSQHLGDLETLEAQAAFERAATDLLTLYEARPVAVAHDLHPDYVSTRWAQRAVAAGEGAAAALRGLPLIAVQHHHAHLAACLADNGVAGPALGVTWDGTGYGPDGTIWGGELLLGDATACERVAHLRPLRLPGGDAAVRAPIRTALALLWELDGPAALERDDLPALAALDPRERRVVGQMLARGLNAPVTTSAGRLFDGVAALAGLHPRVTWEGQAAVRLEALVDPSVRDAYPLPVVAGATGAPWTLDWEPLVRAVVADVAAGRPVGLVSARFHNALADAIVASAGAVGAPRVALTGGCFQNRRLLEAAVAGLRAAGHEVLLHREVPPNDGGVALGQVLVAAARLRSGHLASAGVAGV